VTRGILFPIGCLEVIGPLTVVTEADEEAVRCLDPEGNGVNLGGGNGGGPGPPSGEQDKQLINSRGEGNTLMERPGRLEEESGVIRWTHRAQSM
jgi:hypothetical protein